MMSNEWCSCGEWLIGTPHQCRPRDVELIPKTENDRKLDSLSKLLGQKLHCLRLEVPASIADDIWTTYQELAAEIQRGEK